MRGWLRAYPVVADTLLALGVVGLQVSVAAVQPQPNPWLLAVESAAQVVMVAVRRRWPLGAAALASVNSLAALLFMRDIQGGGLGIIVVGYTIAAYLPVRRALAATVGMWTPTIIVGSFVPRRNPDLPQIPFWYFIALNLMIALVVFFIGRTVHNRRAYTRALEERARTAEENQRALADQAVAEERRRIARELHDVVAHHVSVMGVLATGARRVLRRDPDAAEEALGTIEETGRSALREMRRLLTVLRTEAEPAADLVPQPGLAAIESLLEQVRDAGLPVTLRVDGDPSPMDPGVAVTVYRIVQEALTNTLKHAGKAVAEVRLEIGELWLQLEIFDTGHGLRLDAIRQGHGLLGMRERVALYGGTLRTGPRPGGGFRVSAKIPMEQNAGTHTGREVVR